MWFSGLAIGFPELLVAILSVLMGIPGLIAIWSLVVTRWGSPKDVLPPPSLYMLTMAVLLDLSGLLVISNLSAEALSGTTFGVGTSSFVMSSFLSLGFMFLVFSVLIRGNRKSPAADATALLSKILLVVALFGIVCIIGCLPQAPWNRSECSRAYRTHAE